MKIDLEKIEQIIRQVAAEQVLPKFLQLEEGDIGTKSNADDFVTVADIAAEKALRYMLESLYPEAEVIGEEEVFNSPSRLDILKGDAPIFVLDPIDGTRNFKNGLESFGMIVSYACKGEIIAGFIYIPVLGKMLKGELGSGVTINGNPQRVNVRTTNLQDMIGIADKTTRCFDGFAKDVYWTGSGALAYLDFSENNVDFISFISRELKPWDHMAGIMLSSEAGGIVHTLSNHPYDYRKRAEKLIVTNCSENFNQLSKLANEFLQKSS